MHFAARHDLQRGRFHLGKILGREIIAHRRDHALANIKKRLAPRELFGMPEGLRCHMVINEMR